MRLDVPKFTGVDPDSWIFSINKYFLLLNIPADQRLRIYEDPQGALSKLLQLGTVEDYQREFEKLVNRVTDTPELLLFFFYISGLKLNLQRELLVSKPTTLGDAFSLARITEASCDNKWVRGHKCSRKFLLLMADDEDDAVQKSEEDAVESGDIYILNSLIGHGSPRSLQLWVALNMQGLTIEVDLYVLPMKGPDVVLGIQWLQKFGKVPTTLPPHRIIDHIIHLLPNTKPVNVRPYRYLHCQKGEMEKLVKEMMEQDYRALNEVIVKDKFPIPTTNEMFDELGGAPKFSQAQPVKKAHEPTRRLGYKIPSPHLVKGVGHQAAETVTTSNELDVLFGPLFDEYFNGENQVVLKSSAVNTTDASNKRQQQPDSTSSTSTLATTVTANGNFYFGRMPTKIELTLEQSQQGVSNDVLDSNGIPVSIICDRDGRFTSNFRKSFQKALVTDISMSTAYPPKTDGQSERTIQTLEDMLRACVIDFGKKCYANEPLAMPLKGIHVDDKLQLRKNPLKSWNKRSND
ncbi:retrotransposon-related protein [Tanacetum coccineum]